MEQLDIERSRLLRDSRANSTHSTYITAMNAFGDFCSDYQYDSRVPPNVERIAQFIAYLSWRGYAASTIQTYISGLSFYLQVAGLEDVTKSFIVSCLLEGCKRRNVRRDTRCPITLSLLGQILRALSYVCKSDYEVLMYSAAFLVAFHGFLRVGEFTVSSRKHDGQQLGVSDVRVTGEAPNRKVVLRLRSSKTDQRGRGCLIYIPEVHSEFCPVKAVVAYMSCRPSVGHAFFQTFGALPLTRYEFGKMIKRCMKFWSLPTECFSSHSFRIGAATFAAMSGCSDEQIQSMGRWSSNTFRRYIRIDMVL